MQATIQKKSRPSRRSQNFTVPADKSLTPAAECGNEHAANSEAVQQWLIRLQIFGFAGATVETIRQLSREQIDTFIQCVTNWEQEYELALRGTACDSPTELPRFLRTFDGATPEQFKNAAQLGRGARIAGYTTSDNPYPPDTVLRAIWQDAFERPVFDEIPVETSSRNSPHLTAGQAGATPSKTSFAIDDADISSSIPLEQETPMISNTLNRIPQSSGESQSDLHQKRQLAIEAARREVEQALQEQDEFELKIAERSSEVRELWAAFDQAGARARQANQRLREARAGASDGHSNAPVESQSYLDHLDRTWEMRIAEARRSLNMLPQGVNAQTGTDHLADSSPNSRHFRQPSATRRIAMHSAIPQLVQDAGAAFDLSVLRKGSLQLRTGCAEGIGLTARQIEKLKAAVKGATIAALEQFQRDTFNWDQAIKGFGPEGITRLQDAQLELRTKFPMPTADDEVPATDSSVMRNSEEDEFVKSNGMCDVDEAEEWLDELIYRCIEVERDITNLEGVRYLRNVKQQAELLLNQLQKDRQVTAAQTQQIQVWQSGVEAWSDGVNAYDEEDFDEDDEDLDDDTDDFDEDEDEDDFDEDEDFEEDDYEEASSDFEDELRDEDFDNEADFEDDWEVSDAVTDS